MKYFVQIIFSGLIFLISMMITWYEGSGIVENSIQWKYSTPFSRLFGVKISEGSDIIGLDYFVYAIKFQPTFPILMFISAMYMLLTIIMYISKFNKKLSNIILVIGLILLICISSIFKGASTNGGKLFFIVTLISVILFIVLIIIQFLKRKGVSFFRT